ncbi:MAG TPA: methyltransferase domain-containing protein [Thermoanaerobaculia bacterium]
MLRLHIGSGNVRLPGWTNVDAQRLPGVDVVADVTRGLDFAGAEAVFSEHFLEHLAVDDALRFLLEVHRVLADGGWVRLTTPNLDWVWLTHYRLDGEAAEKREAALAINRAFRGWRHQFLWNREMLAEALAACGFEEVRWCRRGESELPFFRDLERHDTYGDSEEMPHILIVEARKGEPRPDRLRELRAAVQAGFLDHMKD